MRRLLVCLAILVVLFPTVPWAKGKNDKGKGSQKDSKPPVVILVAPDLAPSRFNVEVEATDKNGIVEVLVSLDGDLAAGRTAPPWTLEVAPTAFPVEVCAVAQDPSGNTGRDCRTVHAPEFPACLDSPQCGNAEFCLTPVGECGAVGLCDVFVGSCTQEFDPVCGCNGVTYTNECQARYWRVNVAFAGSCPPCTVNSDCTEGYYCQTPVGQCGGEGACAPRYGACPGGVSCGCDGRTYPSACAARYSGINIASDGECP